MDWIAGWSKRIKLTIDHTKVGSDLTNFPVLINLDSTCSGVFNELGNNSKRISFINHSTHEQYFCEIERWDSVNQSAQLWVKLPTVSSGISTELYMLYDNTASDNSNYIGLTGETAGQQVWDDNFIAVYHMSQDPSTGGACILDSTSNGNHGTPYGDMTSDDLVDGLIGKALDFDENGKYIALPSTTIIPNKVNTLEYCNKYVSGGNRPYGKGSVGESVATNIVNFNWSGTTFSYYYEYGGGGTNSSSNYEVNVPDTRDGEFHNLSIRIQASYYIAGVDNTFITYEGIDSTDSTAPAVIGPNDANYTDLIGIGREFRTSSILRSDDWLTTTNYSNNEELLSISAEELQPEDVLDYRNKVKLIIPYSFINSSLYNFPILINLSSSSGLNSVDLTDIFTHLSNTTNRKKIALTDHTGLAQLYVEIERWSHAENSAQLWVKIPEISPNSDTILYFYYDVSNTDNNLFIGDTNSTPAQNVWDDNFTAVYHMSQDPSTGGACILDSTSNAYHGTPQGAMVSNDLVNSKIGKATYFNGSNYIQFPAEVLQADGVTEYTLEITMRNNEGYSTFLSKSDSTVAGKSVYLGMHSTDVGRVGVYGSDLDSAVLLPGMYKLAGAVNNIAGSRVLFVDEIKYTDSASICSDTNDNYLLVPSSNGNIQSTTAKGIRISNVSRSDEWLLVTYYTEIDQLINYSTTTPQVGWLETYEEGSLSPWAKRIKLEIDSSKVDSHLIDFPVLINLSESSGYNNQDISNVFTELDYGSVDDDFTGNDGEPPSTLLWNVFNNSGSGYVTTQDNTLHVVIPSTSNDENAGVTSKFEVTGDIEITIDYDEILNNTPSSSISYPSWFAVHTSSGNRIYITTRLTDSGVYSFACGSEESGQILSTASGVVTGKLKISRLGDTFTVWYWSGTQWEWDSSASGYTFIDSDASTVSYIEIKSVGDFDAGVTTYFDNFLVNSGSVLWPQGAYPNRKKLAITSDNGTTQLPIEIENWDILTESVQLWVKVPNITSEETTIMYLYYDVSKSDNIYVGDTGTSIAASVWDENFVGVYHMSQDPSTGGACILDSTSNGNHGTPYGDMTSDDLVDGLIGKAIEFDNVDDFINIGDIFYSEEITMEIAAYNTDDDDGRLLVKRNNDNGTAHDAEISVSTSNVVFWDGPTALSSNYTEVLNEYITIVGVLDVDTSKSYLNGELQNTNTVGNFTLTNTTSSLQIGCRTNDTNSRYFGGKIGSVRVSTSVRSDEWLKTSDKSDTDTLIFFYSEEVYLPPYSPSYFYHGYIKEKNMPVQRNVFLYNRMTGSLVDQSISDSTTGYYLLETSVNEDHFIVVMDDDTGTVYDPIIQDKLAPNGK